MWRHDNNFRTNITQRICKLKPQKDKWSYSAFATAFQSLQEADLNDSVLFSNELFMGIKDNFLSSRLTKFMWKKLKRIGSCIDKISTFAFCVETSINLIIYYKKLAIIKMSQRNLQNNYWERRLHWQGSDACLNT